MGITFSQLKSKCASWNLNSTITAAIWADLANIAKRELEEQLNFDGMITVPADVSVTADDYEQDALSSYKELKDAWWVDSDSNYNPLTKDSESHAMGLFPNLTDDKGTPQLIVKMKVRSGSTTVDKFWLRPTPDEAGTLKYRYYAYTAELSEDSDTNYLLDGPWQVWLYATLAKGAEFVRDDAEKKYWWALALAAAQAVINAESREKFAGSPQQMKTGYTISGKAR